MNTNLGKRDFLISKLKNIAFDLNIADKIPEIRYMDIDDLWKAVYKCEFHAEEGWINSIDDIKKIFEKYL